MFKTDLSFNQNGTYHSEERARRGAISVERGSGCGLWLWVVGCEFKCLRRGSTKIPTYGTITGFQKAKTAKPLFLPIHPSHRTCL